MAPWPARNQHAIIPLPSSGRLHRSTVRRHQLAVVLDGRGLADETMQAIAREMSFSETTFALPAEQAGTDVRVRIFTPDEELPMAGHPTIGTAFALARTGAIAATQDRVTFGLGVGPTPVSLVWRDDGLSFAWMQQAAPTFGAPVTDLAGAGALLRLPPAAVAGSGLPVQTVSCGVPYLMIPLATRRAVDSASLDPPAYHAFRHAAGIDEIPATSSRPNQRRPTRRQPTAGCSAWG
jgi:trans-2,3-dihydro-3-hydroxyanthranilate isomerase